MVVLLEWFRLRSIIIMNQNIWSVWVIDLSLLGFFTIAFESVKIIIIIIIVPWAIPVSAAAIAWFLIHRLLEFVSTLIPVIIIIESSIIIVIRIITIISETIVIIVMEWLGIVRCSAEILISLFYRWLETVIVIVGKIFGDCIFL